MRISDWSSDVCSSDLERLGGDLPVLNFRSTRAAQRGADCSFCRKHPQEILMQIFIHTDRNIALTDAQREGFEQVLAGAVDRFDARLTRIEVHLSDVNSTDRKSTRLNSSH